MDDLLKCKEQVVKYSRLAYDRNLVTAAGGNVSMRCGDVIVMTASGVSLRDVAVENLITCDLEGKVIDCPQGLRMTKEHVFHVDVYKLRPDIDSVIHVHPAYSIAFSARGREIPILTGSAKMKIKNVPIADYAYPGTLELAGYVHDTVKAAPKEIHAIVLKNHGILAYEKGMSECFDIAELVEDTARIAYLAETLPATEQLYLEDK